MRVEADVNKSIALSFKNVQVSSLNPSKTIINNISGYVVKGGITAVLGASASGKSVLLNVLAGRLSQLPISGEVMLGSISINPNNISNKISYVPQDEFLMGELTPRETLKNIATMKTMKEKTLIDSEIDHLLESFGLSHVADNPIGTVFVRGLSGGQRKRVEVCSELISPQSILLLDEPTSGLDGAIAYEILSAMKNILHEKNGDLSIMLTIHQPNSRILELFDHILLLGNGSILFFGTVQESLEYFTNLGFMIPSNYTPTDIYLQLIDKNFGSNQNYDFEYAFITSKYADEMLTVIEQSKVMNNDSDNSSCNNNSSKIYDIERLSSNRHHHKHESCNLWREYSTLVKRDFIVASRDPSLYYLQFVLVTFFGFLVGAGFFKLQYVINYRITNVPAALLWIVMMMSYIQVFKVYHLSKANYRFKHEISNNTYTVFSYWFAELTTTAIMLSTFIPGTIIAYFMMGLPSKSFPFLILLFWMNALTAETMLNFITKFSSDATVSIVSSQAALVILTVFGGGMFIAWNKCPNYWFWMQELSLFTQASRSAIMNVMDSIDYTCSSSSSSDTNTCISTLGEVYICDVSPFIDGICKVSGRMVLHVRQGTIMKESKWVPFAYLVLIFIILRLAILFLMYYPVERILFNILIIFKNKHEEEENVVKKGSSAFIQVDVNDSNKDLSTDNLVNDCNDFLFVDNGNSNDSLFDRNHIITTGYCLEWKNLSVTLKQKGTVLIDRVSGVALPGRILALMGPSGAGKTTLLNALSNRAPYAELLGEVTFGKRPFTPADLVYVPQFDEFNQDLTIYEQIEFIGNLKCVDKVDMYKRLDRLIPIIGLSNKVHTLCKHLTSGELKRVSVSIGMIANPNVLFLDEPTTGLDSSAAYSIVKFLSNLSKATNVVIIMTIHQPAQPVFDMLQDLYLLEKGRLAYFGPMNTTEKYFLSYHHVCPSGINPADFYLDLVNNDPSNVATDNNGNDHDVVNVDDGTANNVHNGNDSHDTWSILYKKSVFYKNYSKILIKTIENSLLASNPRKPPNSTTRFLLLLDFFRKYYSRNIGFYYLRLVFLIIVALFVGTLFLRLQPTTNSISQYAGALFFNIWANLFSAVASTGLLASDRRQAIEQVKNAVITPGVYCLAQFIMSIPFNFILAVVFQSIFHWLINMNPHGEAFIYAILITMGHLLLMESIMLTVVAILKNAMLSVTFAMVVMGYLFLFSGFFVRTSDMPLWIGWLSYITPTRYSFDGYLWQIFDTQNFIVSGSDSTSSSVTGKSILNDAFDLYSINSWGMFGALLGWIALFRLSHYIAFAWEVLPYTKESTSVTTKATAASTTATTIIATNKHVDHASMKVEESDEDVESKKIKSLT